MNLSEHKHVRFKEYTGLFHALTFVFRLINTLLKHTRHRKIYRQGLKEQTRISSAWNLLQLALCNWYCKTRYESWNKPRTEVAKSVTKRSFSWCLFYKTQFGRYLRLNLGRAYTHRQNRCQPGRRYRWYW